MANQLQILKQRLAGRAPALQTAAAVAAATAGATPRGVDGNAVSSWEYIEQIKRANPEAIPWPYYDHRIFAATAFPGDAAAVTYATFASPLQFFQRTVGLAGPALTNMGMAGATDCDFVCERIAVEVHAYPDAPSAAGASASANFVTAITQYSVLQIEFGGVPIVRAPVSHFPAGGGVALQGRAWSLAIAADHEAGFATNGAPDARAAKNLEKPLVFKASQPFTAQLFTPTNAAGTAGPLQMITALTALAGNTTAGIRINLIGWKAPGGGANLLRGVSAPL